MPFVEQEDVLNTFEGMMRTLFKNVLNVEIAERIPRMSWYDAMDFYGSDKPDIRFDMKIHEITDLVKGYGFSVFDAAVLVDLDVNESLCTYLRSLHPLCELVDLLACIVCSALNVDCTDVVNAIEY